MGNTRITILAYYCFLNHPRPSVVCDVVVRNLESIRRCLRQIMKLERLSYLSQWL
jgi:hypothetical protein